MKKYVIILVIGIAIGYGYGFTDAKKYESNIVARMVAKVGGSNRGKYDQNLDSKVERALR